MTTASTAGRLWLYLYRTEQAWQVADLAAVVHKGRDLTEKTLQAMHAHGSVLSRRSDHRKNGVVYLVDASCKVPRDITLGEIVSTAPLAPAETREPKEKADKPPRRIRGEIARIGKVASVWALGDARRAA